jgi:hypothetical protein
MSLGIWIPIPATGPEADHLLETVQNILGSAAADCTDGDPLYHDIREAGLSARLEKLDGIADALAAGKALVERERDSLRAEVERLGRALAGHLFDGESVNTREAIRNELMQRGVEEAEQLAEALAEVERMRSTSRIFRVVMDDWRQEGVATSIYGTELGLSLSTGDMHSGTTFEAKVELPPAVLADVLEAWREHRAYPVFRLIPHDGAALGEGVKGGGA